MAEDTNVKVEPGQQLVIELPEGANVSTYFQRGAGGSADVLFVYVEVNES